MPLFMIATPIGHLKDITYRAVETLANSDLIICEDTRVTSKLLAAYHITKSLWALHEHSKPGQITKIIGELQRGKRLCYVSDAGTPGVNDPGGKLVAAAYEAGMMVVPIPGPSALTSAISVCGFPMDDFSYHGFAPHKKGRASFFRMISENPRPSV
ncbi:MAG: ribosomal RNA small subunit methyltransferase I, partial [Patescibacteria group bacterium]